MSGPFIPGTGQVCGPCEREIGPVDHRSQVRPGVWWHLYCALNRR